MLKVIIIAGPTAVGKSHYATEIAKKIDAEIINADSIQCYRELQILSARPSEKQDIPHHLYGFADHTEVVSAGKYQKLATSKIIDCHKRSKTPIIVGGTGLYINALKEGISIIPEISSQTKEKVTAMLLQIQDFYEFVCKNDPKIKEIIGKNDNHRLRRALEVKLETGKSITDFWHSKVKLKDFKYITFFINPDREFLYQNCNNRFEAMLENGAIEEAQRIISALPKGCTVSKAIGFREIEAFIENKISFDEMKEKAKQSTRNYAKRQLTWFKNQLQRAIEIKIDKQNAVSTTSKMLEYIENIT